MPVQAFEVEEDVEDEIIVTGTRLGDTGTMSYQQGDLYHTLTYDIATNLWIEGPVTETPPPGVGDDPDVASDTVQVKVTNPANLDEALQAAANVLEALNKLRAELSGVDPGLTVTFNGDTMTAGQLLDHLNGTTFEIIDTFLPNGGVGGATYSETGDHLIQFHFESFDGDGAEDYAHPNYVNGAGLAGIILHELGHVSDDGYLFDRSSHNYYTREMAVMDHPFDPSFVDTTYWSNNEAYANAFSQSMANGFGIDIEGWNPEQGFTWIAPEMIYSQNVSGGGGGVMMMANGDPSVFEVDVFRGSDVAFAAIPISEPPIL